MCIFSCNLKSKKEKNINYNLENFKISFKNSENWFFREFNEWNKSTKSRKLTAIELKKQKPEHAFELAWCPGGREMATPLENLFVHTASTTDNTEPAASLAHSNVSKWKYTESGFFESWISSSLVFDFNVLRLFT